MGKPDQISEITVRLRNVKIVSVLRIGIKAGPDIVKALDPVLVFIRGTKHLFEFVERIYILSISDEQVSQPDMQVGCLSGLGKLLCIF